MQCDQGDQIKIVKKIMKKSPEMYVAQPMFCQD
jgi:hypothetical protein